MVSNTENYWVFGLFLSSGILENTTFQKLDVFPSPGEGGGGWECVFVGNFAENMYRR
jgi:hypothetical protein